MKTSGEITVMKTPRAQVHDKQNSPPNSHCRDVNKKHLQGEVSLKAQYELERDICTKPRRETD